jgi:hypothetical protein
MTEKICAICGKSIAEGYEHYIQFKGEVCESCFVTEIKKAKEQWVKDHPCPFKTTGTGSPQCKLIMEGTGITGMIFYGLCIKEQNCPIYNGGMK